MAAPLRQVLVVEPEFYARVQLDDDLAPYGFSVTSVKSLRNALIKIKAQVFHAVIISYEEDAETPLRLLATLRNSFNQVPVLVLTKRPTEAHLHQLMNYKPVEVVVKPYALMGLVQRLQALTEAEKPSKKT